MKQSYADDYRMNYRRNMNLRAMEQQRRHVGVGAAAVPIPSFDDADPDIPDPTMDPAALSGLVAYWRCDQGTFQDTAQTTVAAAGDSVAAWADQSGNGYHATQATAGNRPALVAGVFGSLPGLRFTRANSHYLSVNALAPLFTGLNAACSILVAYKHQSMTATQCLLGMGNSVPANFSRDLFWFRSDGVWTAPGNTTAAFRMERRDFVTVDLQACYDVHNGFPDTAAHVVYMGFDGSSGTIWMDGVYAMSRAFSSPTLNLNTCSIGAVLRAALANCFDGDLGALYIYNRGLSSSEIRGAGKGIAGLLGIDYSVAGTFYVDTVSGKIDNHGALTGYPKTSVSRILTARGGSQTHVYVKAPGTAPLREACLWNGGSRLTIEPLEGEDNWTQFGSVQKTADWTDEGSGKYSRTLTESLGTTGIALCAISSITDANGQPYKLYQIGTAQGETQATTISTVGTTLTVSSAHGLAAGDLPIVVQATTPNGLTQTRAATAAPDGTTLTLYESFGTEDDPEDLPAGTAWSYAPRPDPAAGQFAWVYEARWIIAHGPAEENLNAQTTEIGIYATGITVYGAGKVTIKKAIWQYFSLSGCQAGNSVTNPPGGQMEAQDCITYHSANGFRLMNYAIQARWLRCTAMYNGSVNAEADEITGDGFNIHGVHVSYDPNAEYRSLAEIQSCISAYNWDEGASAHEGAHMTITGGSIHHNGHSGVYSVNKAIQQLDGVEVYNNWADGTAPAGVAEGGAVGFSAQLSGYVKNCNIHDNNCPGIVIAAAAAGAIVRTNNTSGMAAGNTAEDNYEATL